MNEEIKERLSDLEAKVKDIEITINYHAQMTLFLGIIGYVLMAMLVIGAW